MIPANYDNPSPLASLDPSRWKEAQARRQDDEEREERRERMEPQDSSAWSAWWADKCRCYDTVLKTLDPNADVSNLKGILGAHKHWKGPVADAVRNFVRQLLADVEERDKEAREKLKAISQETFNATQ